MAFNFINRLSVDAVTGRAVVSDAAPAAGSPTLGGFRFANDGTSLYVRTGAVPSDAVFMDSFAFDTSSGRLCVLIDDPPAVGSRFYRDGVLGDSAGHMCLTAVNAIANYVHGWPVDAIGQVCVGEGGPPPPPSFVPITSIQIFYFFNDPG